MPGRRILFWTIFCWISSTSGFADDDADLQQYFAGLRGQGLFSVAEEYGLMRLAEPEVTPSQQAILSVELSKVFASHAAEATSNTEADELWARANETIEPLLALKENPRWATVRSRQATLLCDRALAEFWKSQLAPDSIMQRDTALQSTQSALASLQSAAIEIKEAGQSAPRRGDRSSEGLAAATRSTEGRLTSVESRRMADEIDYLIVRMHLNIARLLPTGPDRAAALIHAEQESAALARHVNSDFVWPARLARAEAMRLRGDPEKAFTYAKSLLSSELTDELADAIAAEQARSLQAQSKPADAIQFLLEQGRGRDHRGPELRAIAVECLLSLVQTAQSKGDSALAEELWKQANSQQQLISGPWRVYVDALLGRSSETRKYGEKLAAIVRDGQLAAQRQDWSAAAQAYELAAARATAEGKSPLAAEFLYMQASIEIEAHQFEVAAKRLKEFQSRFPDEPRSAEVHLLAAWILGQLHDTQPSPARRADYLSQLREHLTKFPMSATRFEAEWSLAVDAIRHQDWATAIDCLEVIPANHVRALEAAAQLPYCYEQMLASHAEKGDLSKCEQRATASFTRQVDSWPKPPAGWTLSQSENAQRWGRVLLRLRERRYRDADQILVHVLHSREIEVREVARDGSKLDPAWDRLAIAATQLRIISLSGMGQSAEAEKLFSAGTATTPEDLLAILSGLTDLAESLSEPAQRDLGRVQLAAARRLHRQRSQLPPEIALLADRCLAEAYTATGDLPEAIALYEALLKHSPRDRQLLETIGALSIQRGQPVDLQRAKTTYRQLEALDPAGSPAWLRTRLTVAKVCLRLGEQAEAAKLLRVTQILYPELGGRELKASYAELESDLLESK